MKQLLLIICGCVLLIGNSCSGRSTKNVDKDVSYGNLPVIDITKDYPVKEVNIQDIAEVEYIPLETTEESLLDGGALGRVACSDSLIVTCNLQQGKVLIFDRTGKHMHSFSHMGGGAEEYMQLSCYCVDFKANEIFISDFFHNHRIMVYSLEGDFKRILLLPKEIMPYLMYNYDNDYLLVYDGYRLDSAFPDKDINKKPYMLFSKKDGKMITLNFTVKERIGNKYSVIDKEVDHTVYGRSSMVGIFQISKNGSKTFVSDFARDTLYALEKMQFIPLIVRTPTIAESNKTILFSIYFRTNRYTLLSSVEKKIDKDKGELAPVSRYFMYDKQTGEIHTPHFYNLDYSPKRQTIVEDNYMAELPDNYARRILSAEMLVRINKEGHIVGRLKEVVSKLQEDDNPVLMLIKFKE